MAACKSMRLLEVQNVVLGDFVGIRSQKSGRNTRLETIGSRREGVQQKVLIRSSRWKGSRRGREDDDDRRRRSEFRHISASSADTTDDIMTALGRALLSTSTSTTSFSPAVFARDFWSNTEEIRLDKHAIYMENPHRKAEFSLTPQKWPVRIEGALPKLSRVTMHLHLYIQRLSRSSNSHLLDCATSIPCSSKILSPGQEVTRQAGCDAEDVPYCRVDDCGSLANPDLTLPYSAPATEFPNLGIVTAEESGALDGNQGRSIIRDPAFLFARFKPDILALDIIPGSPCNYSDSLAWNSNETRSETTGTELWASNRGTAWNTVLPIDSQASARRDLLGVRLSWYRETLRFKKSPLKEAVSLPHPIPGCRTWEVPKITMSNT
ncbi:uncharacterized protein EV420DRAFT_1483292 [Desarmillaria tabescens]|uniref:Uncharacterized protein n=1 Tax=Armillaria tabescens TaxID=1929756 RepID=A0AA39JV30_ARMTA|nr:uncharacterized protein EV420DRAFT_1483292 [Desarmillaria tabescens]KAK0449097.1 hypothetical protein EV420DRAFT_1483292 [Desarmillaria tabescens]